MWPPAGVPQSFVQGRSSGADQAQTHPVLESEPSKKTRGGPLAHSSSALALHSPSSTRVVFGAHQGSPPAAAQDRDKDAQGGAVIFSPQSQNPGMTLKPGEANTKMRGKS